MSNDIKLPSPIIIFRPSIQHILLLPMLPSLPIIITLLSSQHEIRVPVKCVNSPIEILLSFPIISILIPFETPLGATFIVLLFPFIIIFDLKYNPLILITLL